MLGSLSLINPLPGKGVPGGLQAKGLAAFGDANAKPVPAVDLICIPATSRYNPPTLFSIRGPS
ncbi:Uncharacterised protein [uncultured archaeon]|nr:Uncharacterised protein [uncultured archaeon]